MLCSFVVADKVGDIVTVGPSGKQYTSIWAALAAIYTDITTLGINVSTKANATVLLTDNSAGTYYSADPTAGFSYGGNPDVTPLPHYLNFPVKFVGDQSILDSDGTPRRTNWTNPINHIMNGKAYLCPQGYDLTIKNVNMFNARRGDPYGNCGIIHSEPNTYGNIKILNSAVGRSDTVLLCGAIGSKLSIVDSICYEGGSGEFGRDHNMYLTPDEVFLINSMSTAVQGGYLVKTRGLSAGIHRCRIVGGNNGSPAAPIDISNGGAVVISNSFIHGSANSNAFRLVHVGGEFTECMQNTRVTVVNNTMLQEARAYTGTYTLIAENQYASLEVAGAGAGGNNGPCAPIVLDNNKIYFGSGADVRVAVASALTSGKVINRSMQTLTARPDIDVSDTGNRLGKAFPTITNLWPRGGSQTIFFLNENLKCHIGNASGTAITTFTVNAVDAYLLANNTNAGTWGYQEASAGMTSPTWSIIENFSSQFALNASTGALTVGSGTLVLGTYSATIQALQAGITGTCHVIRGTSGVEGVPIGFPQQADLNMNTTDQVVCPTIVDANAVTYTVGTDYTFDGTALSVSWVAGHRPAVGIACTAHYSYRQAYRQYVTIAVQP
jgi:hypothetical protein